MMNEQKIITISPEELVSKTANYKTNGFRLVAISCATLKDHMELSYSFDKEYSLESLRINLTDKKELPSISSVFWNAFLYENEIHDLFGVKVTGINIDYKGNFYKTTIKNPFANEEEGK
jgi:ech hydrogenase subunit D